MGQLLMPALLWFAAIGCGLIAGLYFAFSTFIMRALSRIAPASGIAAMNSINGEIVKSLFMPLFLLTPLASAVLVIMAVFRMGEPGVVVMLVGGVLYVLGMFVVTMIFNVPLNNALARVDPASAEGAALWARYLKEWTFWNHVRTIASLAASVLFTVAICSK